MQKVIDVALLVKGCEDELSTLNEYFFYCLKSCFEERNINLDLNKLYSMSVYLTKKDDLMDKMLPSGFLREYKFKEDNDSLLLDVTDLRDILPKGLDEDFYKSIMADSVLTNFLAEYSVRLLLREELRPLRIRLNNLLSLSSATHIKTYSTISMIGWLFNMVSLDLIKAPQARMDLELEELLFKASVQGTLKSYEIQERIEVLKERYPIGTFACLYSRDTGKGRSDFSKVPVGIITGAKIIEILGYTDEGFRYKSYNCYNSKAEVLRQFNQIAEDKQYTYMDMLNPKVSCLINNCSLYNTSVDEFIAPFDSYMLSKFNNHEIVTKEFKSGDKFVSKTVTAPVAVYLLLKEYGVLFNEELFKETYGIFGNIEL